MTSKRNGHYSSLGRPKQGYSRERAEAALARLNGDGTMEIYRCGFCLGLHLGHKSATSQAHRPRMIDRCQTEHTELGERAVGCMITESSGSFSNRYKAITSRARRAQERLGVFTVPLNRRSPRKRRILSRAS